MNEKSEIIQYKTAGTCCQRMFVQVENGIVTDAEFLGGCNGNLQGIKRLIKGMAVQDVIARLKGVDCGGKGTSCPDQLARCLEEYLAQKQPAIQIIK